MGDVALLRQSAALLPPVRGRPRAGPGQNDMIKLIITLNQTGNKLRYEIDPSTEGPKRAERLAAEAIIDGVEVIMDAVEKLAKTPVDKRRAGA